MKNRKSYITAVVTTLTIASLFGCSAKKNPARDALNAEKAAQKKREAAQNMKKDVSSVGGQPSVIFLYGTVADPKHQDQITAAAATGLGWKGKRPRLRKAFTVHMVPDVPSSHNDVVNVITSKDYINLGCDQKTLDAAIVPGTL